MPPKTLVKKITCNEYNKSPDLNIKYTIFIIRQSVYPCILYINNGKNFGFKWYQYVSVMR